MCNVVFNFNLQLAFCLCPGYYIYINFFYLQLQILTHGIILVLPLCHLNRLVEVESVTGRSKMFAVGQ